MEQVLDESRIIKFEFSDKYHNDSGYRLGHKRYDYFYIKVKHIESWVIGDWNVNSFSDKN